MRKAPNSHEYHKYAECDNCKTQMDTQFTKTESMKKRNKKINYGFWSTRQYELFFFLIYSVAKKMKHTHTHCEYPAKEKIPPSFCKPIMSRSVYICLFVFFFAINIDYIIVWN